MSECDFIIAEQRLLFIIALLLILWQRFIVDMSTFDIAIWPDTMPLLPILSFVMGIADSFGIGMVDWFICANAGATDKKTKPTAAVMNLTWNTVILLIGDPVAGSLLIPKKHANSATIRVS